MSGPRRQPFAALSGTSPAPARETVHRADRLSERTIRIALAGGGTAGHVYPALAVLAELNAPDTLWLGSERGMEAAIVRRAGISFAGIPAGAVLGRGPLALARSAWANLRGVLAARARLRAFKPGVVLATGGYVSVPAVLAARSLGLPTAVYLPDVEPGLAVRALARVVDRIACTFEASREYLPPSKVVATGYPVRADLRAWASRPDARAAARAALGLSPGERVLLVMGGSLGAGSLNGAVWSGLERLLALATVLHIAGEHGIAEARQRRDALPPTLTDRYRPVAFVHDDMAATFAASDAIVCRSGASVLGELPAFGLPAVLVPGRFAGGHQRHNAEYLAAAGAATIVLDEHLSRPDALLAAIAPLLGDDDRLAAMAKAARGLDRPDAAADIARMLDELSRRMHP